MDVYKIDPLRDPRWPQLLKRTPQASVFHTAEWLEALKRTYGYEPAAYTTSPPEVDLENGWVFCHVQSWITGRRMVSLPFSDHCNPLVSDEVRFECLARAIQRDRERPWDYVEFRPLDLTFKAPSGFRASQTFCFHRLDLRPTLDKIFGNLHKGSVQRKVRRAERERLTCEGGRSENLLNKFYDLLIRTRRRHGLPPQPRRWFRNLICCVGEQLTIRIASKDTIPVAGIMILNFKNKLVYKYGCSDERFFNVGGMQFLLWQAIADAKQCGAEEFDLGRSDPDDEGLIVFKDRFGAKRSLLTYFRSPLASRFAVGLQGRAAAKRLVSHIPNALLSTVGRIFYGHLA